MQEFLRSTAVINWSSPAVARLAASLRRGDDTGATARTCFEFVRDEIKHSSDFRCGPATCTASDALLHRTGFCFSKSHLLAALLRANNIPAGFCYQRLSFNNAGPPYCLHGFNAVHLPTFGWFRVDPRGNKPGIDAQFDPPRERLAFARQISGEVEFENILPDPLACVTDALLQSLDWNEVLDRLPDVAPEQFASLGLLVRS